MNHSTLSNADLQHILLTRAMKRTEEAIEKLEYSLARMRLKQAARNKKEAL